jgi:hypothetical protein
MWICNQQEQKDETMTHGRVYLTSFPPVVTGTLNLLARTAELLMMPPYHLQLAGLVCGCWSHATGLIYTSSSNSTILSSSSSSSTILSSSSSSIRKKWNEVPALRQGLPGIAVLQHWLWQQPASCQPTQQGGPQMAALTKQVQLEVEGIADMASSVQHFSQTRGSDAKRRQQQQQQQQDTGKLQEGNDQAQQEMGGGSVRQPGVEDVEGPSTWQSIWDMWLPPGGRRQVRHCKRADSAVHAPCGSCCTPCSRSVMLSDLLPKLVLVMCRQSAASSLSSLCALDCGHGHAACPTCILY